MLNLPIQSLRRLIFGPKSDGLLLGGRSRRSARAPSLGWNVSDESHHYPYAYMQSLAERLYIPAGHIETSDTSQGTLRAIHNKDPLLALIDELVGHELSLGLDASCHTKLDIRIPIALMTLEGPVNDLSHRDRQHRAIDETLDWALQLQDPIGRELINISGAVAILAPTESYPYDCRVSSRWVETTKPWPPIHGQERFIRTSHPITMCATQAREWALFLLSYFSGASLSIRAK